MGLKSILSKAAGAVIVVGGLYVAFGDNEAERSERLQEVQERAEAGGRGVVRTGAGLIEGLADETVQLLEENGIDVSNFDSLEDLENYLEENDISINLDGSKNPEDCIIDPSCFTDPPDF